MDEMVIVGGGSAGFHASEVLRNEGFAGSVVMVGAEPELPYQRPPLSKGYLLGTEPLESATFRGSDWFVEQGIEMRTGVSATDIDRAEQMVALSDGTTLHYDALLLATGSRPRHLPLPGADLPGVLMLRTMADARSLRERLQGAQRTVVIGGGWIGLEVTAAARTSGTVVSVLEAGPLPLVGPLGPQIAQVFADLHVRHGVDLRCGAVVEAIIGTPEGVEGVRLAGGELLPADLVLVGVGVQPNTELAQRAGLAVDNGVAVDEHLRTSDPAIWAAGDIASAWHPVLGRRIRVEHAENAVRQGRVAGLSMLGDSAPYDELPFFYTDQYELGMEYVGYTGPGEADLVVVRGDVAALKFVAFWLSGRKVAAAMHVNVWDATDPLRDLVRRGEAADLRRLADAEVPLGEL